MTQEEKAKAYDKAIEKIRYVMEHGVSPTLSKEDLQDIFPELFESEDEKIRDAIIDHLKDNNLTEWAAWLEKQGEKPQGKTALEIWKDMRLEVYQQASGNRHEPNYSDDTTKMFSLNDIDEIIEKISEQKLADKVEPRFHKGDWIIHQGTGNIYQVVACIDNQYQLKYGDNYTVQKCADVDRCARLWTIQEAKDGDVLSAHECIVLFKEIDGLNIKCHCAYHYLNNPSFYVDTLQNKTAFHPATKKEHELLSQKMKEYEWRWGTENKKLKKIEQKSAWSKRDGEVCNSIIDDFINLKYSNNSPILPKEYCDSCMDWLKSLKDRVLQQRKQEWSEEDSIRLQRIIDFLWYNRKGDTDTIYQQEQDIDWLKSIKDRYTWKPSKEQIVALRWVLNNIPYNKQKEEISGLLGQIKDL